jgi:chemotaxis protein MotB
MAAKGGAADGKRPIVIRKEEVIAGGHHGGAWKVAYADFVTAMMAFFLLMWLLNATTAEQRAGIADYFAPTNITARGSSGFGGMFGGHTPNDDGTLASDRGTITVMNQDAKPNFDVEEDDSDTPASAASTRTDGTGPLTRRPEANNSSGGPAATPAPKPTDGTQTATGDTSEAQLRAELAHKERASFDAAAKQIRDEVAKDPALADLSRQLSVDITREGLRIQILDEDKQAMFASGSSVPNDRARALLLKIAPVLMKLPERLSITGHTDSAPYRGGDRSNWELSAERANATRRLLADAGLPEARVETVSGQADRDPLLPADPMAAVNRRIAIVVLRNAALPSKPKG